MNTTRNSTRLVDDLAGHWTEPALEILKSAGIHEVSVRMELETWLTLKNVLHSELRWQRAFRSSSLVSLSTLMEQVLARGILLVAQQFEPEKISAEFERRVQRLVRDRRPTVAERDLYAEMVQQPKIRVAFKPPSRTDFYPRLQVSAIGR